MAERIAFLDGFKPVTKEVLCECLGDIAGRLTGRAVVEAPLYMSNHYVKEHFEPTEADPQLTLDLE